MTDLLSHLQHGVWWNGYNLGVNMRLGRKWQLGAGCGTVETRKPPQPVMPRKARKALKLARQILKDRSLSSGVFVDASSKRGSSGMRRYIAIVRVQSEGTVASFSTGLPRGLRSDEAELVAVEEALSLCPDEVVFTDLLHATDIYGERVIWIPRDQNKLAHGLARGAANRNQPVFESLLDYLPDGAMANV